jgi:hypothetical protein
MDSGQTVLIKCFISSSAFSGERVFRIGLADGTKHFGVAPVSYCYDQNKAPLGPKSPPQGEQIKGLVQGRVIANGNKLVKIAIPDGEAVEVKLDEIAYIALTKTEFDSVSIRS